MGSKNLLAIAADGTQSPPYGTRGLKDINREINLGEGSMGYRDDGGGGTWRMVSVLHPVGGLPEFNFAPRDTEDGRKLMRDAVEAGPYVVTAEGCYLCGIKCHKNVYNKTDDGEKGRFRAKVDYEPLALLTSNLGIYDDAAALDLIELTDELGMDAISLGVTLGYAMEWNRRHPEALIAEGLAYGDAAGTGAAIERIAAGEFVAIGQGTHRLAIQTGESDYAMHSKGVEFPAYLPHTNPAYPWALAGGHMSMKTYLLAQIERETDIDYWVDATTNRGPTIHARRHHRPLQVLAPRSSPSRQRPSESRPVSTSAQTNYSKWSTEPSSAATPTNDAEDSNRTTTRCHLMHTRPSNTQPSLSSTPRSSSTNTGNV